jgi:uncharacterized protein (TIGR03083 family)
MRTSMVGDALRVQRATTVTLLESLDPGEWDLPCLPGWRVREVVAHLIAVDEATLSGRMIPLLRSSRGRAAVARWKDRAVRRWADRSPDELLAGLTRWGARLAGVARAVPVPLLKLPIGLLYGRLNLGAALLQRVLDEYVHMVDIARATGRQAACPHPLPTSLAEACLARMPGGVLPRVGRTVGVVRLEVGVAAAETAPAPVGSGGGPWQRWGLDFARKHYGPRVGAQPDATVRLHASVLALLVEARADWRDAALSVEIEGDEQLAAEVLDALGVTAVAEAGPA